ncbi:MAG: hypothetical protein ACR2M1_08320, partial [Gemmatimonadaceae bacterium]
MRAGIAVACALAEIVRETPFGRSISPGEVTVATSAVALAERSGYDVDKVVAALASLAPLGVTEGTLEHGVRLATSYYTDQPGLAPITWPAVREALQRADVRVAPALAVVRAAAIGVTRNTGSPRSTRPVRIPLRTLAMDSGYAPSA